MAKVGDWVTIINHHPLTNFQEGEVVEYHHSKALNRHMYRVQLGVKTRVIVDHYNLIVVEKKIDHTPLLGLALMYNDQDWFEDISKRYGVNQT